MSNKFKRLFSENDFKNANKFGIIFMEKLQKALPSAVVLQNDSQSRTDKFEGSPGFEDDCDIWIELPKTNINFEITGDVRYTRKASRFLLFNKFSVNKLLSSHHPGFAVYYLGKEDPPLFFLKRASVINDSYAASPTKRTVRGDTGIKFKIPVQDWIPFDDFVVKIKTLTGIES